MSRHLPTAGLVITCGAALIAILTRKQPEPPIPATKSAPSVIVDSPKNCEKIRETYRSELAKVQSCTSDDECVAEVREGVDAAIDGCGRFTRKDANLENVIAVDKAWLARGCANKFVSCGSRRAGCIDGQCAELPPDPIPRTWRRITHTTALKMTPLSFFLPPDLVKRDVIGEDGDVGLYEGTHYEVHWEYGEYAADFHDLEGVKTEPITVSGVKGVMATGRMLDHTFVLGASWDVPSGKRFQISGSCKRSDDCKPMQIILRSVEFY